MNLRVMEHKTHDSITANFQLRIVKPPIPKINHIYGPIDIVVQMGQHFEYSISHLAFDGVSTYALHDLLLTNSVDHTPAPSWITFNYLNLSLTGLSPPSPSNHRFNLLSPSHPSLSLNLKLTVVPPTPASTLPLYLLSTAALISLLTYLLAILHLTHRY